MLTYFISLHFFPFILCFLGKLALSLFSPNSSLKKKKMSWDFVISYKSSLSYQSQQYPLVVAAQCAAAEKSHLWFKGWHVFPRRLDKQTGFNATIDRRAASDRHAQDFFCLRTLLNSQAGSLSLTESETSDDFLPVTWGLLRHSKHTGEKNQTKN